MKLVRISLISGIVLILAALTVMAFNGQELKGLADFTQWYAGYDVNAGPNYNVPRLPETKNLELVAHVGGRLSFCAMKDNLAAIANGTELLFYDLTDPASPKKLGSILLLSKIEEFCFDRDGKIIYVADGRGGLRIIDISDPKTPKEIATFGHRGAVQHVFHRNRNIYVASKLDGLQILRYENNKLELLKYDDSMNHENGSAELGNMCASADYLVSSDTYNGLRIMILKDPEFPVIKAHHTKPHVNPDYVALDGNNVMVASSSADKEQEVQFFQPDGYFAKKTATIKIPDMKASGVILKEKRGYVFGDAGLVAIDLTDVNAPKIDRATSWTNKSEVVSCSIEKDKGCLVTKDGKFIVFSLQDKPKILSTIDFPTSILSACVDKESGKLFVGSRSGVYCANVATPANYAKFLDFQKTRYVRANAGKLVIQSDDSLDVYKTEKPDKLSSTKCSRSFIPPVPFGADFLIAEDSGIVSTGAKNIFKDESVDAIAGDGKLLVTAPQGFFGFQLFDDKSKSVQEAILIPSAMHQKVLDLAMDHGFVYYIQGKFLGDNRIYVKEPVQKLDNPPSIEMHGARRLCVSNGLVGAEEIGSISVMKFDGKKIEKIAGLEKTAVPFSLSDLQLCGNLLLISAEDAGLYIYLVRESR